MAKYLIALHGLGLHGGYLVYLRDFFVGKGYVVECPDLLGFGHTTTQNRGDIASFHDYTREVAILSEEIRRRDHEARVFLWGENIGGTVALMYALEYPRGVAGVVAVNPVLSVKMGIPRMKRLQWQLAAQFSPNRRIDLPFFIQDLTDDPQVAEVIAQDDRVCSCVTARFFGALSRACAFLWTDAPRMRIPFVIQYSVGSQLVSESALRRFVAVASSSLKEAEPIEGPALLSLSKHREEVYRKAFSFFELVSG